MVIVMQIKKTDSWYFCQSFVSTKSIEVLLNIYKKIDIKLGDIYEELF